MGSWWISADTTTQDIPVHFSTPVNNLELVKITLPKECKVLVTVNEADGTCTCGNLTVLDRLTQQVMGMTL